MSWEQLSDILHENAERRRDEDQRPPEACPNDGEPLVKHPTSGLLHCPWDGYTCPA